MALCSFNYHDGTGKQPDQIILENVTTTPGVEPYIRLKFGDQLIIFTSAKRLTELSLLIDGVLAKIALTEAGALVPTPEEQEAAERREIDHAAETEAIVEAEERADAATEEADFYEDPAARCPPRE
jgi:hypothetical protein